MKSILIIGMGSFGCHLCRNLAELGNEIMIVDIKEEKLEEMLPLVVSAKIGDCTNPAVLESLGAANFDIVFVCIGTNFQSSLEITSQVKEMGAKRVVSKATRNIQAKFLLRNGADEVIYPDRDTAERMAVSYSSDQVFDYFEVGDGYGIYEIKPLPEWIGKTLEQLNLRSNYKLNVLGFKKGENAKMMPEPDYVVREEEHLMVLAHTDDIKKILKDIG